MLIFSVKKPEKMNAKFLTYFTVIIMKVYYNKPSMSFGKALYIQDIYI